MRAGLVALMLPALSCAATLPQAEAEAPPRVSLAELEARGFGAAEAAPHGDDQGFVLRGATVLTAAGDRFEPGFVQVGEGRILAVGPGEPPAAEGVHIIDASGAYITPGLIDLHSHLGVYPAPHTRAHDDGNEATDPLTPGVWAEHSFWPQDPDIERAVAGGITTLQALPGSANLVGGRGVTLHLVPARGSRAMRFPGAPETVKLACGENPKRVYGERGGAPSTRMGNLRALREGFLQAQHYQQLWDAWEAGGDAPPREPGRRRSDTPPERDLDLETLAGIMRGEILPQIHCYRADDMLAMIQVSDEFGFQIAAFHHALEAYKIRDVLAERGIAAATWADWWGFKMEAYDGIPYNAGLLTQDGARAIIHSDSEIDIQRLNQEAAKAWTMAREVGLAVSEDDALRWITLNPAAALGLDAEVGSLEVGKRADLVVWSGSPFSVYSRARYVFIDGALRYDPERRPEPWSDLELGQEVSP